MTGADPNPERDRPTFDPEALRQEALRRLRERRPPARDMNPADMEALVHELEVHQVELEVQNEELRRAEAELTEARDRYFDLYEFAPVAYLTLDEHGTVRRANMTAARLTGRDRPEIISRRLEKFLHRDDRDACYVHLQQAAALTDGHVTELRLDRPDGQEMHISLETTAPAGGGFRVTMTDITERKRAQRQLARQRELLERIIDGIPVLLVIWDADFKRFQLNRHCREVLGWDDQDANDGDFMAKVYPDPEYRAEVAEYMKSLQPGWREIETATRSGERIPIDWANVRLSDQSHVGIGVDLRERKRTEAELWARNEELERFNRMAVGREKRMIELKQEVNALCAELGRPPAHNLDFLDEEEPQRRPGD